MLISQGSFRVCKIHNVILLILLTFFGKTCYADNLLKKSTAYKNFTWARAQMCHVHPTPMGEDWFFKWLIETSRMKRLKTFCSKNKIIQRIELWRKMWKVFLIARRLSRRVGLELKNVALTVIECYREWER